MNMHWKACSLAVPAVPLSCCWRLQRHPQDWMRHFLAGRRCWWQPQSLMQSPHANAQQLRASFFEIHTCFSLNNYKEMAKPMIIYLWRSAPFRRLEKAVPALRITVCFNHSRASGTGKGKSVRNVGSTMSRPLLCSESECATCLSCSELRKADWSLSSETSELEGLSMRDVQNQELLLRTYMTSEIITSTSALEGKLAHQLSQKFLVMSCSFGGQTSNNFPSRNRAWNLSPPRHHFLHSKERLHGGILAQAIHTHGR